MKIIMRFKKLISLIVTISLLISFVIQPSTASIIINKEIVNRYSKIFDDFVLPYGYGQITKAHYAGTDRVIINIQDLHCHPKVQKNISNIIETFDNKFGINKIYLEGAYGKVSTNWLTDKINQNPKKEELLDTILETGRLTGAEYYSAKSGKTEIINGLEEKEPYLENLKRFGKIIENQEKIDLILKAIEEDSQKLKKQHYTKRQFKLENLSKKFKEDKLSPQKYYTLLSKHIDKLGIDLTKYENTFAYIMLLNMQSRLNFSKITEQMQSLLFFLKQILPYNTYKQLIDNTDNFSGVDKLYTYIIKLCRQENLDLSGKYSELDKYFRYIELSQKINPLDLISEEAKLTEEINTRFSETKVQRDIVFMTNFEKYLRDYVTGKITSDDYNYYKENIETYKRLWNKYADNRVLSMLDEYMDETDKFYKINNDRNLYFAKNLFNDDNKPAENHFDTKADNDINKIIANMKNVKKLDIVVTGGFHSNTVTEMLKEKGVSYIVITPNVSDGIDVAQKTYYQIAKEQSKISFQMIAPAVASISPSAQQIINDRLTYPQQKQKINELDDEERIQLISDLAAAKILESDDIGDIRETITEVVKATVDDLHKQKVTPELVSEIKNLQTLISNKENLQRVIDLLQKGTAKQSLLLISDMLDDLYKIFDSFEIFERGQKIISFLEETDDAERKEALSEENKIEFEKQADSASVEANVKDLQNKVVRASGFNRNIIDYIRNNQITSTTLLNKLLLEFTNINYDQKEIYCKIITLLEKEEYIYMFFNMDKISRNRFTDFYEYALDTYSDDISSIMLQVLLDIVKKNGYTISDFDKLYNYCEYRFIAELKTRENISDFLNLNSSIRNLIFDFYKKSEHDYSISFSPLKLKFILILAENFNYTQEDFNYLMKLITRADLKENSEVAEEYIESFKGKKVNGYILENFRYVEFYNRYVIDLLFSDFDVRYGRTFDFQKFVDLVDDLETYRIDSLDLENKAFSMSVFFSKAMEDYCKQNDIKDITRQYQLAIRVARRIYSISGDNIFSIPTYKIESIIADTLEYYNKLDAIIADLYLIVNKMAIFSIHNNEKNADGKTQRFTPVGIEEILKKLDVEPDLFEYIEISFADKVLDFINTKYTDEINVPELLEYLEKEKGSVVVKKDIVDYINRRKDQPLSKKTLLRYVKRMHVTETMVEANMFLHRIERFNEYGQEKGLFIFDGHGLDDEIFYSSGRGFTVKQISQALINAHDNGVNLRNITLMFSSCHSYKFAENVIKELINIGIDVFPQIITDAGKETVYAYTKTMDSDNKTIKVSNLFYSLIKLLDSKTPEELKQMNGKLSLKDVANAPRYLSNNTLFITNDQIDELNHSLVKSIRAVIEEDDDNKTTGRIYPIMEENGMYVDVNYNKYAQLMLPSTQNLLTKIGNSKIIKSIYKENSGKFFKTTKLGVAIGVLLETFVFWTPNFINAHNFPLSIQTKMTPVIWVIRALSIGIGIGTGSLFALFITETTAHFVWNYFATIKPSINNKFSEYVSGIIANIMPNLISKIKDVSYDTVKRVNLQYYTVSQFVSEIAGQMLFINELFDAVFKNRSGIFGIIDKNIVITEDYKQKDYLQSLAVAETNIIVVNMEIITEPTQTVRGGFILDVEKGIRVKYDKSDGKLTVYSKKGIDIDKRQLQDLITAAYYDTRKNDSFETAIVFADLEEQTLYSIQNKLKNEITNSITVPGKEIKLDISERNITDISAVCKNEEIASETKTFIISKAQAEKYNRELQRLQDAGYKFIISYDRSDEFSEVLFDGARIIAEDITEKEKALELLEKLKTIKLAKGIDTKISIKFSNEIYYGLYNVDIFDEYGIIPIVDDINGILFGKKEFDMSKLKNIERQISDDYFERILRMESFVSVVIDENTKMFINKNKSKFRRAETNEQKFKKGINAALSRKFDYTAKDVKQIIDSGILSVDIGNSNGYLREEILKLNLSLFSDDARTYIEYLTAKEKYEETVGFIRGVVMNTVAKNIANIIDIDENKLMKNIKTDTVQAILILTIQNILNGNTMEDIYKTKEIESEMTAKEFLDSIKIRLNGDLDNILRQNEYKITKVSPSAIADFTGIPELLMDTYGKKVSVVKSAEVSTQYIKSLLSAA